MSAEELGWEDIYDVRDALYGLRDLIALLQARQVSVVDGRTHARLQAMLACPGFVVKSPSGGVDLSPELRAVLDSVTEGRGVPEMTTTDFGKIACRYAEWLPVPLSGGWRSLIYDIRP